MNRRARLVIAALTVTFLVSGPLTAAQGRAPAGPAADGGAAGIARARLAADAGDQLVLKRDAHGVVVFAGVPATGRADNPAVTRTSGIVEAARAHLSRYGAAFGADRPGTTLAQSSVTHTVAGRDVVRFAQQVGGVPVIGAEVVVSLRPDRELGSMLSTLSSHQKVPAALVSERTAGRSARAVAERSTEGAHGSLRLVHQGRWLFDPEVLGAHAPLGARAVWRFEVTDGAGVRRLVLVDDRSGGILLDIDLIQQVDRVVCDKNNVQVAGNPDPPCTSGFARTEGSPASGVVDVNTAFDLSGVVSDYYEQIGGLDLTEALGIDVLGVKKLASTVRFCYSGVTCPYPNAFWNGLQMYYGQDYAGADDVVGHEMTHGVIDQYSRLFYWGQSGAINESLADIMGEIVDHRHPSAGDSAGNWALGEDLPGFPSGIRNLKDPTLFSNPDRMTSALWEADTPGYNDNGGVHTNSGVSNKTAYLISQGGTFNGQTITGIDGGDASLTKTAKLYLNVIQSLSSGSDYADLGLVLDQSCQDLLAAGTAGFTADNCTNVHTATVATELGTTPTNAPQPPDAADTCPTASVKRVLFDSETGTPGTKFSAGATWGRAPGSPRAIWGSNATSGISSWYSQNAEVSGTSALVTASAITLPSGQQSFLWFQHWRLLEYDANGFYDGGTVEVDDVDTAGGAVGTASLPWVNGPTQTLATGFGNPKAGKKAFAGDSSGFIASRVDLSSFQGKRIKPRFSMNTDSSVGFIGWFLDDIRIYTCDVIVNHTLPKVIGTPAVGNTLTAKPGTWTPSGLTFTYKWYRGSVAIPGATAKTYKVVRADRGSKLKVKVKASGGSFVPVSKTSKPTATVT